MPAMAASTPEVKKFFGLNNVTDPLRLGLGWLTRADNVDITDSGAIEVRKGYSRVAIGSYTGAFSTFDAKRMYLVDAGALKTMSGATIKTGLSLAPMHWCEVNDQVFYNNGVDSGILNQDNSRLDWTWAAPGAPALAATTGALPAGLYRACFTFTLEDGRETGAGEIAELVLDGAQSLQISGIPQVAGQRTNLYLAPADSAVFSYAGTPTGAAWVWGSSPDALGHELMTANLHPLPAGCDVVQEWGGRMYAAQYFPELGQTAVWFSQPMAFHLFDLSSDFLMVAGRVLMLAPHKTGLVIGTNDRIVAYTGAQVAQLADYGVVPGQHWAKDGERVIFWSTRGVCSALPFSNLTESAVSVAPGVHAGGAIVQDGGQKRYVVALQQGGSAFNSFN